MSQINVTSDLIFQTDQAQQNLKGFDNLLLETLRRWSQQSVKLNVESNIEQVRRELDDLMEAAQRNASQNSGGGNSKGYWSRVTPEPPGARPAANGAPPAPELSVRDLTQGFHRETQNFVAEFRRVARQHAQDLAQAMQMPGRTPTPVTLPQAGGDSGSPGGGHAGTGGDGVGGLARQLRRTAAVGLALNAVGQFAEGAAQMGDAGYLMEGQSSATILARRDMARFGSFRQFVGSAAPIVGPLAMGLGDLGSASLNAVQGNGFRTGESIKEYNAQQMDLQTRMQFAQQQAQLNIARTLTYDPAREAELSRRSAMTQMRQELSDAKYRDPNNPSQLNTNGQRLQQSRISEINAEYTRSLRDVGRRGETLTAQGALEGRQMQTFADVGAMVARGQTRLADILEKRSTIATEMQSREDAINATAPGSQERAFAIQRRNAYAAVMPQMTENINAAELLRVQDSVFHQQRQTEAARLTSTGNSYAATFGRFNAQAAEEMRVTRRDKSDEEVAAVAGRIEAEKRAILTTIDNTNIERSLGAVALDERNRRGEFAGTMRGLTDAYHLETQRIQKALKDPTLSDSERYRLTDQQAASDREYAAKQQSALIRRNLDLLHMDNENAAKRVSLDRGDYEARKSEIESRRSEAVEAARNDPDKIRRINESAALDQQLLERSRQNQLRALDAQNAVRAAGVFGSQFDAQSMAVMARRQTAVDAAHGDVELINRANKEAQLDQAMVNRGRRYRLEDLAAQTGEQHTLRMSGRTAAADTMEMVRQSLRDVNEAGTDRQMRTATADAAKAQLQEQMSAVGKFQFASGAESLWQIAAQSASDKTDVLRAGAAGLKQLDRARNMTDDQIRRERGQDVPGGFAPPPAPALFGANHANPRGSGMHNGDARDNSHSINRLSEVLEKLIDKLHKHEV